MTTPSLPLHFCNRTQALLLLFLLQSTILGAFFVPSLHHRPPPTPPLPATTTSTTSTTTIAPQLPGYYDLESWASLFQSVPSDAPVEYWLEGSVPTDLDGTLLTVGPAKMERGGVPVKSWLDGDGYTTAISFQNGKAHVKSRFVQTPEYRAEAAQDRFLYRGQFGTMKTAFGKVNALDMSFKNPSNTRPIYWGGKLLSCFETGLPYELDPRTLDTKGEFTFGNLLKSGQPITAMDPRLEEALNERSGHAFTAHARVDPSTNRLLGWSWKTLLAGSLTTGMEVSFYEWNHKFQTAFPPTTVRIPGCPAPPHDWIVTENYYVWVQYALKLDLLPCVLGLKGPGECLVPVQGKEAKAIIHLIPRPGGVHAGEAPLAIETEPYFMTHWSHAFEEDEGGKIVGYAAGWDKSLFVEANVEGGSLFGATHKVAPDFSRLPIIRLYKMEVDMVGKAAGFALVAPLENTFLDFPKVHPRFEMKETTHLWAMACNDQGISSPPQGYVHLNVATGAMESWHAPSASFSVGKGQEDEGGKHVFVGEGVLAPRAGGKEELDCYWMGMEFDANTGRRSLCIFDAARISQGPLCKLHLKHSLPWGIHSEYVPGLQTAEP